MTIKDKKTKALNQSGAFLQIFVLTELIKRNWDVEIETPRTFAPFVEDPINKREILFRGNPNILESSEFPEAVSQSQDPTHRNETSLDIYAGKVILFGTKTATIRLCIEVKKNDPRYVDWCFFQQEKQQGSMRIITNCIRSIGRVDLFRVPPASRHSNDIFVQTHQLKNWKPLDNQISDFALALHGEEINKEYYRSEKTRVDEAARQIIKGTYGTIVDHIVHQVVTGQGYSHNPDVFIPVIVINANLFLCEFNAKDIDSKSGQIKKDPKYIPLDSIIYEYPKPKEVQFPAPLAGNLDSLSRRYAQKWHILITSPNGFVNLLENIGDGSEKLEPDF